MFFGEFKLKLVLGDWQAAAAPVVFKGVGLTLPPDSELVPRAPLRSLPVFRTATAPCATTCFPTACF